MSQEFISIIGGTGKEGQALAKNWAASGLNVILGSRDESKAKAAADAMNAQGVTDFGQGTFRSVRGENNLEAVKMARYIVLSVPYESRNDTVKDWLHLLEGKVLVDITIPLKPGKPPSYLQPAEGSGALELQSLVQDRCPIVSGFHTLGAGFLDKLYRHRAAPDQNPLDEGQHVFVCGDDELAKAGVLDTLANGLMLTGLDAGPLRMAETLERLVPLLIGLNIRYKRKSTGIMLTGI